MASPPSATKLRVGYVPEHFSSPLLQLAASDWGKHHIELVSQPSGTGQMLTSLRHDADAQPQVIDVAVALTEALIAALAKGRDDYRLVGSYVRSSLNWAVITGTSPNARIYNSIDDLRGTRIGISRIGSGSQIMASVMALEHGWTDASGKVEPLQFKVQDTFANLRRGVNQPVSSSSSSTASDGIDSAAATSSRTTGQCTAEEFRRAAEAYVAKHVEGGAATAAPSAPLGAHSFARGWQWKPASGAVAATATPGELVRSFQLPHSAGGGVLNVTQSIVYSSTWKVPVLYLSAFDSEGSPLSVERLQASPLFRTGRASSATTTKVAHVAEAQTSAPPPTDGEQPVRLSLGDHPLTSLPTPFLHPCETAAWLQTLLPSPSSSATAAGAEYLEAFVSLCNGTVDMRAGAAAEPEPQSEAEAQPPTSRGGGASSASSSPPPPPPETSAFMWEWFTTKPFVDSGEVRFIGSVPTPWPSWTIAASTRTALSSAESRSRLEEFLARLESAVVDFTSERNLGRGAAAAAARADGEADEAEAWLAATPSGRYIVDHFGYLPADVHEWLSAVRWTSDARRDGGLGAATADGGGGASSATNVKTDRVSRGVVAQTLRALGSAGVVEEPTTTSEGAADGGGGGGWRVEAFVDDETRLVD